MNINYITPPEPRHIGVAEPDVPFRKFIVCFIRGHRSPKVYQEFKSLGVKFVACPHCTSAWEVPLDMTNVESHRLTRRQQHGIGIWMFCSTLFFLLVLTTVTIGIVRAILK